MYRFTLDDLSRFPCVYFLENQVWKTQNLWNFLLTWLMTFDKWREVASGRSLYQRIIDMIIGMIKESLSDQWALSAMPC